MHYSTEPPPSHHGISGFLQALLPRALSPMRFLPWARRQTSAGGEPFLWQPALLILFLGFGDLAKVAPKVFVVNSIPRTVAPSEELLASWKSHDPADRPAPATPTVAALVGDFAGRPIPVWPAGDKGEGPRIALAKLLRGDDAERIDRYLLEAKPVRGVGSTWEFHYGDHDFAEAVFIPLLYLAGEKLSEAARRHLMDVLLVSEGEGPGLMVPRTSGIIYDTENHILMTESSRYLKNQWLCAHGAGKAAFDNEANGMTAWILGYLNALRLDGFYEFNSIPYEGYALLPLLSLEAFAEPPEVAAAARAVLDEHATEAALRTLDGRQAGPFRRQLHYLGDGNLAEHVMPVLLRVWGAPAAANPVEIPHRGSHALLAGVLPYRPSRRMLELAGCKPGRYFARLGHGPFASPEILSGSPETLLVAGGAWRGPWNKVIPRPTVLLVRDGAENIAGCLHLPSGGDPRSWNNTGVYEDFAVGPGHVHVPESWRKHIAQSRWAVYASPTPRPVPVAVYTGEDFSAIWIGAGGRDPAALLQSVRHENDEMTLRRRGVTLAGTHLEYDIGAPAGTWVIETIDGTRAEREYDRWPRRSVTWRTPVPAP